MSRPGAAGSRAERRAAAGDPVGEQRRAPAAGARRPARGRAACSDLAGLFARLAGLWLAEVRLSLLSAGVVFVSDPALFEPALAAAVAPDVEIVHPEAMPVPDRVASRWRTSTFESWLRRSPTSDVDRRHADIQARRAGKDPLHVGIDGDAKRRDQYAPDDLQQPADDPAGAAVPRRGPPVLVDWLPWHHTFGGNHNIGIVVYNGGSLYLDEGRPLPGAFEESVRNLRDVAPTIYLNVPKGYEELVRAFRKDPELAAIVLCSRAACSSMPPPACRSTSPTSSRRLPLPPAASVSCSSLASAPPKRRRWRSAGRGRAISRRPSDCRSLASKSSWPRPW